MGLDSTTELHELPQRQVLKREYFPHERMNPELMDKWSESIPSYSDADAAHPEWRPTPLIEIDLTSEGYGTPLIKNEADTESNPTGTIKDRAGWELATTFRDWARALYLKIRRGELTKKDLADIPIPTFSLMTAGNEGRAIASVFAKHELPPPKLIIDVETPKNLLEELRKLRATIVAVDLSSRELSTQDILNLTDNQDGVDITSVQFIEPQAIFYDWHVHEVFNEKPARIYVPRGSGRLMENYLYWQNRTQRNDSNHTPDPRLRVGASSVMSASVIGAEPEEPDSSADKLLARFRPFLIFKDQDINGLKSFAATGTQTGVHKTREDYIQHAFKIFQEHKIDAEPSAAVGLALYMQQCDKKEVNQREKIVIVNTGKGLYEEKSAI